MFFRKHSLNLREKQDFFQNPQVVRAGYFSFLFHKNNDGGDGDGVSDDERGVFRATVVVGKKVSNSAVVRNKNKRLVFNLLAEEIDFFSKLPIDLAIIVHQDLIKIDQQKIRDVIKQKGVIISRLLKSK